ncbi:MAG: PQQ-dependent dehydrogenase, methanol/ethanol family [Pseudomonadota bacterium]|nr:PQQ-dependent dehydrogenase, methanol/ethanol family [Pseudomonadota bacterium]
MKLSSRLLLVGALFTGCLPAFATLTTVDTSPTASIRESLQSMDGERLANANSEPGNWLAHGRTYSEQRYSPLESIDTNNVGELGLAWYWDTNVTRAHEATPIVVDGIMYATGPWSEVYALDARTGELLWRNDLNVDKSRGQYACCDVGNRGPAVWKGKVFVGTIDGRMVALDAVSGEILWDTLTIDLSRPYTITGAPRVFNDKVIIGNGGAEYGVRGYVTAYDTETGEQVWRFYTVPGNPADGFENKAMEMAAETWGGGPWWEVGGGGTAWNSFAYDPELNLIYIGVGNGSPWNKYIRSPAGGDNLFLSSIVAVDADTGDYVWHYQTTPGEGWDYTATEHMILADLEIDGRVRKVIMQAPKNGFFYVLDRETGEFISAKNFVPVTWATHIDPDTGRPVETDNDYKDHMVIQQPSPLGGHNWMPMCYSPDTGLVYFPAQEMTMVYDHDEEFVYTPGYWNVGMNVMKDIMVPTWVDPALIKAVAKKSARGYLLAWDPVKQQSAWRVDHGGMWNGGMLCTAGGLVFEGNGDGIFGAYDAETGRRLWEFEAQSGIIAPPITYEIDGEQYVTVLVGYGGAVGLSFSMVAASPEPNRPEGRIMTFKLGASEQLPAIEKKAKLPEPPPLEADRETIAKGNKLYHHHCVYCHGPGAISSKSLDDLRYMDAETHANFNAIVLGGSEEHLGMPGHGAKMSVDEVEAIHAYLTKLGHKTLKAEQAPEWWKSIKSVVYGVLAAIVGFFTGIFSWLMNAGA